MDGVAHGYRKREALHFEREKRREVLLIAAACKKELFHLLDLSLQCRRGRTGAQEGSCIETNGG